MMELDEFIEMLDDSISSSDISSQLNIEYANNPSMLDLINIEEKFRVLTIKKKISSTHNWQKATNTNVSSGEIKEIYWCEECHVRCSVFEHLRCLSIVSKVNDHLPTYTVHNKYLMLTCNQVRNLDSPTTTRYCFDCGISAKGGTISCHLVDVE